MNLLENKKALRDFVQQADVLNTLTGGISNTNVDIKQEDNRIVIKVSAPSVPADSFKIFLNYNQLIIYSVLNEQSGNEETQAARKAIPMFSKTFEVPVFINTQDIEAIHEDNELKVILPFKENMENFKRNINIRHQ